MVSGVTVTGNVTAPRRTVLEPMPASEASGNPPIPPRVIVVPEVAGASSNVPALSVAVARPVMASACKATVPPAEPVRLAPVTVMPPAFDVERKTPPFGALALSTVIAEASTTCTLPEVAVSPMGPIALPGLSRTMLPTALAQFEATGQRHQI